jgi:hypothetical protein
MRWKLQGGNGSLIGLNEIGGPYLLFLFSTLIILLLLFIINLLENSPIN